MFDVITFGSAVIDVFVDTDIAEKKGFMAYPVGSKILLKDIKFDIGGGGTNTAVAFSRLGLKTGYMGKVGDDTDGKSILNVLHKEKIKFLGKIEKQGISGYSIILDSKENNRTILTFKGTNNNLKFDELKLKKIKTKWLYLTSLLENSFIAQKKLVSYLASRGIKIAFNPSSYLIKRLDLKPILKFCEVIIFNKEEAQMLAKKNKIKNKNLIKGLHDLGVKIIVITDKNKKIWAYDGIKKYSIQPHKIKVVERTGAGDAFGAGFVAGLIVNKSIEGCLKLGLKESESVLRHFGAKNNLLRMKLK
ncbi:MAG: carbohydrate kinase family protein [Nanoarchaeota archaeon]|nr:carbohydrate kinase family protein [Nanoarchaeota archaeon]MBU1027596.1 carbohydrate kinase family protein [Nanoarchaeota archaeon]